MFGVKLENPGQSIVGIHGIEMRYLSTVNIKNETIKLEQNCDHVPLNQRGMPNV